MRKALVWASISILTLIAIIVGTSWYLLRPNNEFRLALSPMLLHDDAKRGLSNSLFNEIHAAIPTIAEYHAALSFKDKYRAINPVPKKPTPGAVRLVDILTEFLIRGKLDTALSTITISINVIPYLNLLWTLTGNQDYFLAVWKLVEEPCDNPDEIDRAEPRCYSIIVSLNDIGSTEESFRGTWQQIVNDIGVYIYREFFNHRQSSYPNAVDLMPARQLVTSFRSLEYSVLGLEFLHEGMSHPECDDGTWRQCVTLAERMFEAALHASPDHRNPSASLGLGILLIRRTIQSAQDGRSNFTVHRQLEKAIRKIRAARLGSEFLDEMLVKPDWLSRMSLITSDDLQLDPKLLTTGHNYSCVMNAYHGSEFEKQLNYLPWIKGLPKELEPTILGYKYDAELYVAYKNKEESVLRQLLEKLDRLRVQNSENWLLHRVYGSHACRFNPEGQSWKEALERATLHARRPAQQIEGTIHSIRCKYFVDEPIDSQSNFDGLSHKIENLVREHDERLRLHAELGITYALIQMYDMATVELIKAASWEFVLAKVRNTLDINAFKHTEHYNEFLFEAYERQRELPSEYRCAEEVR